MSDNQDEIPQAQKGTTPQWELFKREIFYTCMISTAYFFGYMNWSHGWFILPLGVIFWERHAYLQNRRRKTLALNAVTNEKDIIRASLKELPAWVHFPDKERAEWLNKIIKQLWPNIQKYAFNLISGSIQNTLKSTLEGYNLKNFKFTNISLGNIPLRISSIKVYENVGRDEIIMDMDVSYAGDCDIRFSLMKAKCGIQNLQLYGELRVVLKPIISSIPLVGGVQAYFLQEPKIDLNLIGIGNVLEIPGISSTFKKSIASTVSSIMVLPNKYFLKLNDEVNTEDIKTSEPVGVLRVHVFEAKELMKKDIGILGKGSSDPYCRLSVGQQEYRTKTIDSTVKPRWDEWCEFVIHNVETQQLLVHLWDKDQVNDESLGYTVMNISDIINSPIRDKWISLENAKHGQVHLRFTWFTLSNDFNDLEKCLSDNHNLQEPSIHSAVLTVFVDSAKNLPVAKPEPYVQIEVGKSMQQTSIKIKDVNPVWEECLTFLVPNPQSDYINFKIMDNKTDRVVGSIAYKLEELSQYPNLSIFGIPFNYSQISDDHNLKCSLQLKIFKKEEIDETPGPTSPTHRNSVTSNASEKNKQSFSNGDRTNTLGEEAETTSIGSNDVFAPETPLYNDPQYAGQCGLGRIRLTLRYSSQRQKLVIIVHNLVNLKSESNNVYVKLYLLPEGKDTKRKSKLQSAPNPSYDETFEYSVPQIELDNKSIKVIVSVDKIMKNEVLGQAIICLRDYDVMFSVTEWFDLIPE